MARHLFGGIADYVIVAGTDDVAQLVPSTTVTCWNLSSGGAQYTDLLAADGETAIPGGELTTDAAGGIPQFWGPDEISEVYFDASGGGGPRRRALATDLGTTISTVSTSLTSHAGDENPHDTHLYNLPDVQDPTVAALIATTPFAIAHRGSGGEFPEHTLRGYEAALAAGATAVEVSVHSTADGVLVAFHDTTLDRMTDSTGPIANWTYSALREAVKINARGLLGPGWGLQDIPTLEEVMRSLYGRCVIFLEAKSNPSVPLLQAFLLARYPGAQRSLVIKAYYQSNMLTWGKSNGFTTWGYVDAATTDEQLDTYNADIDMWGVPHAMIDARIAAVVARGKKVICWEVHRHSDVTRLTGLGVQGLMESQYLYLNKGLILAADLFDAQVSIPGTLGVAKYDEAYALQYDGAGGAYIPVAPNQSVLMGGHKAPADSGYTIAWKMKWPTLPTSTLHSGIAFGKASDDVYQFSTANATSGYHVVIRGSGDMQLFTHTAGVTSGTQIGSTVATVLPVANTYMSFDLQVTPTQLILRRTDVGPYTLTVANSTYRGRYWHLSTGSITPSSNSPRFSDISVT